MTEHDKQLPKPPGTPFRRKRQFEDTEDKGTMMADRMAVAAAEGKLEEFMQREMPEGEHARSLAMMMMGMTGMMPIPPVALSEGAAAPTAPPATAEEQASYEQPPEDVMRAIQSGDVNTLMDLLRREYRKRTGGDADAPAEENNAGSEKAPDASLCAGTMPNEEKGVLDALMKIAADNKLDLDWLITRALKLYVQEYMKTGRL